MQSGQVRETEDRNKEAESVADKHSAYQRRTCAVSQLSRIFAESRQLRIHTRKEMFPGLWLGCCDAHTEKLLLLLKNWQLITLIIFGEPLNFPLAEIWHLWFLAVLSCGWIANECTL